MDKVLALSGRRPRSEHVGNDELKPQKVSRALNRRRWRRTVIKQLDELRRQSQAFRFRAGRHGDKNFGHDELPRSG